MATTMYSFKRHYEVDDCYSAISRLDAEKFVSLVDLLPIHGMKKKGDKFIVTYIYDPNARFGGKDKTTVTIDRGRNHLKITGLGGLSYELRISCLDKSKLLLYMVVTGRLLSYISKKKAEQVFEALSNLVTTTIGARRAEEAVAVPATRPRVEVLGIRPQPSQPLRTPAPAVPALATGYVEAREEAIPTTQTSAPQPMEATTSQEPRETAVEPGSSECIARLVTAGLAVDEDLSREVPLKYSPLLRRGGKRIVEYSSGEAEAIDLSKYRDANYIIRLFFSDSKVDIVRLPSEGKVGIYYKGPDGEIYGIKAIEKIVAMLCDSNNKLKLVYWVIEI
jgi:hydrogenase maturation factor